MPTNLGGIAQGLETGLRMAQSIQDRNTYKEERDREFGLRTDMFNNQKARQAALDARDDADYGVRVADNQHKSAVSEFANVASQYGSFEAAPPEVQARLKQRADEADTAIRASRSKRNQLAFGTQQQNLDDVISNLQTGRVSIEDVPSDKLYLSVANALKRDPSDFMGGADGSPSIVSKAVGDTTTGIETKNNGMLVRGANVLFAPDLRLGVGTESAHGGKIVAQEIAQMIPHPTNPYLFTPILKIYVDEGKDFKGPRGQHGETSYYLAPLTQSRTSDPNDPVKFVDMRAAVDRVGQMGMLSEMMNQPEFRKRMEEGQKTAGARSKELIDTYFAQGQAIAPKRMFSSETIRVPADGGYSLLRTKDAQGRVIGTEKIQHPEGDGPVYKQKLEDIDNLDASEEDKADMRKKLLSGVGPDRRGARGGSASVAGKAPAARVSESETKGVLKDVERVLAGNIGIRMSPLTKTWVEADGKPANPEKIAMFNQAYASAAQKVRDGAASGQRSGLTAALDSTKPNMPTVQASSPGTPTAPPKYNVGEPRIDRNTGEIRSYQADGTWKLIKAGR